MSYPEPHYLGDTGEINFQFRPNDTTPELNGRTGGSTSYLAKGEATRGQFGLYRMVLGPKAPGPSPHFHKAIGESFYVLSGSVALYNGEKWIDGAPGDFLYIQEGGIHAFGNHTDEPATMLLLFTPGAPREDYFERVGTVGSMTEEERTEFFLRHDTFWL